ncbi:MAG TPA: mandelate racemase/muconate lactonizing enzyme family protein, partial [Gammaproteobacteria bacterium]|nr:mandelate racemase/muconate lactonizing enzyme family protein [Gammaproteobacteria bacterium]
MRIEKVQTVHVDAGWRPWSFVKITTDQGLVGWSECTDSHGSPRGIEGVIKDLESLLLGEDPRKVESLCWRMMSRTRQSPGSVVQKAIGGIENALWDVKAKALGVPVYELFGGPVRDEVELYWSHCGTTRVRAADIVEKRAIRTQADVREFGKEVRESGFKSLKTNLVIMEDKPYVYMPGFFKSKGGPALNVEMRMLRSMERWISALRDGVGDDIGIAIDLNFNFRAEGYITVGKVLGQYDPMWLEIDCYDPKILRNIKESLQVSVVSCENLLGPRQYKPFFDNFAMDVASIDVLWNGFGASK